jgi:hypothetical protein
VICAASIGSTPRRPASEQNERRRSCGPTCPSPAAVAASAMARAALRCESGWPVRSVRKTRSSSLPRPRASSSLRSRASSRSTAGKIGAYRSDASVFRSSTRRDGRRGQATAIRRRTARPRRSRRRASAALQHLRDPQAGEGERRHDGPVAVRGVTGEHLAEVARLVPFTAHAPAVLLGARHEDRGGGIGQGVGDPHRVIDGTGRRRCAKTSDRWGPRTRRQPEGQAVQRPGRSRALGPLAARRVCVRRCWRRQKLALRHRAAQNVVVEKQGMSPRG